MGISDDEKIERITKLLAALNAGELDDAVELSDSDIVLVRPGGAGELRGVERLREWMEPDAFESQVVEPLEFRVAGNKILVRHRTKIHGAGSGIEADFVNWTVWTYNKAGLVTRFEIYLPNQEEEAHEAAGLSPRPDSRPGSDARSII